MLAMPHPVATADPIAPRRGISRRSPLSAPLVLLLVAWALHWRTFGVSELGQDGFLSADLAAGPLPSMVDFLLRDVHPPLFYAALHGWFALTGLTYVTAKFLPVAAATLAVAAMYGVGLSLVGRRAALLAVGLLIASPAAVLLAPTVRDFSMGLFLSLLTLLLALRLSRRPGAGRPLVGEGAALAIATAAALLTWYFHWCFLATEAILLTWRGDQNGRARRAMPLLAGVLLTAPWYAAFLPRLLGHLHAGATAVGPAPRAASWTADLGILTRAIVGREADPLAVLATAGWALALAVGAATCFGRSPCLYGGDRRERQQAARLVLPAGLLLSGAEIALVLLHWAQPVSLPKYVLAVLPFAVLLQVVAVGCGPRRLRGAATAGASLAVAVQVLAARQLMTGAPIDWTRDPVAQALATEVQPGDVVLFSDHAVRGQYLLQRTWAGSTPGPTGVIQGTNADEAYLHDTPQEAQRTVAEVLPASRRLWYVDVGGPPGGPDSGRSALASVAFIVSHQVIGSTDLQLYGVAVPDQHRRPGAALGAAVTLVDADFTGRVRPGGLLAVRLLWRDDRPVPGAFTVFVHLDDAHGRLVAQQDGIPGAGLRPTDAWQPGDLIEDRHGVVLPPSLPAGAYRLNVGLYRGEQRLALPDGNNAVDLGPVQAG